MGSIKTLRLLTFFSFLNTIGIILVSPFEDFAHNAVVRTLPFIFGTGCFIQFIALFFAGKVWRQINFVQDKQRTRYIIVLSFSLAFAMIWVLITIATYLLSHLFDGIGLISFGTM
jgi:hypothetical protein